jgi:Domain of unknown function (DUF6438)/Ankyrin repeats (3 copies)/Ankyrin repeat
MAVWPHLALVTAIVLLGSAVSAQAPPPYPFSNLNTADCPPPDTMPPAGPATEDDFVVLARSACYGPCPVYKVAVFGNGEITWDGAAFVAARGERKSHIEPAKARRLFDRFRTAQVWSLCRSYSRLVTDNSSADVTISLRGQKKTVHDYAESAPPWFRDLQLAIDDAADTHFWRHGDPPDEPLINILQDTHLPKPGVTPLMQAAARGDGKRLQSLLADGADVAASDASGWTALMYGAARPTPGNAVEVLLAAGADPNHISTSGDTALMAAALTGNVEQHLLNAGANVNAQNHHGVTPLMILATRAHPEQIQIALHAGANAALKDTQGRTALDYLEATNCHRNPLRAEQQFPTGTEGPCDALDPAQYSTSRQLLGAGRGQSPGFLAGWRR